LLHGLELLQKNFNIDRIDVVLLSHFHDDHIAGVPLLQRLFNIECWVPSNFAELVEHPEYHRFPCGWPQPVRVDRRLSLQQPFEWENFRFQLAPMSGHTRFSSAFLFEADGLRFAHVGDQFFAMDLGDPARPTLQQNHVYRNGASTESYKKTAALMKSWRPNIILTGHRWPYHTSEAFFERLDEVGDQFKQMHQSVMVLGEDEIHFGLDSWGGWIWPYRFHLNQGEAATARVTVRNPVPEEAALTVRLVGPEGWQGSSKIVQARPRQEISCELSIWPPGPCRRQPITAELLIGNRTFGHVAEALVTVGGTCF
jgi:glyoxylase-like metal-dependent hydrolase (beta-lactamase superfamily II)